MNKILQLAIALMLLSQSVLSFTPKNKPAMKITDVDLKGIVHSRKGYIAIVQFPWSNKTVSLKEGDKLSDGYVLDVHSKNIVFCKKDETTSASPGKCTEKHVEHTVSLR